MEITRPEDAQFATLHDLLEQGVCSQEIYDHVGQSERDLGTFFRHPGGADQPQLFEIQAPPNTKVEAHAHAIDEIVVIVDGELSFGAQRCTPGTSIFIPALTLYSFTAGPDGVRFLNFRPNRDQGHISKDELMAMKR